MSPSLSERNIIVVVTGGIAAYKAVDFVSRLRKAGARVRVVMTGAARQFVTPLTFEAICGHPVYDDLFERPSRWEMEHITWARWADAIVVAPATANILAKMAAGLADDAASTLLLACRVPIWVAPAMNTAMWDHSATRDNLERLQRRGVCVVTPSAGPLACGEVGAGRLAEPADLVARLEQALASADSSPLTGRTVLITAGPTREPLDPVRFISNRSSGRMGVALARAALCRGAHVVLIHGPMQAEPPSGADVVAVETARQMLEAVQGIWNQVDVAVFAAAVGNFEPACAQEQKIKSAPEFILNLTSTPDIAAWAGANRRAGQLLIGFAAETQDLEASARHKLREKSLDLICANLVGRPGTGFEAPENQVLLLTRQGERFESPQIGKPELADWIWSRAETWMQPRTDVPQGDSEPT